MVLCRSRFNNGGSPLNTILYFTFYVSEQNKGGTVLSQLRPKRWFKDIAGTFSSGFAKSSSFTSTIYILAKFITSPVIINISDYKNIATYLPEK